MPTPKLDTETINAAIQGFEQQKTLIDSRIAELQAMLTGAAPEEEPADSSEPAGKTRRKMSAASRKRMAEAQRRRRVSEGQSTAPVATKKAPKAKRKLSAEGKAAIVAALKKRWAVKRAEAAAKKS